MEMQEVISRAERNIRQALRDYGAHTSQTDVLDDVTDEFIYRLAADSSYAKQGLRKLFSKSPVWNEELDALVINGTRTHDPDYDRIHRLAMQILERPFKSLDYDYNDILKAVCFFSNPDASERDRESYIEAIRKLAPKAYTPTKKPSRVFKSLCVALGVADETAGSEFQRLYAQFADELSAKKISFKLFVSINPAHFITMSNPKRDLPTHVTIRSSGRVSTALCEQISTVSVERLGNYCGHVSDSELAAIENAMLISLGIQLASVSEESEETPPCRNHGSPKSKLGAVSCRSCMTLCWTGSSRLDENIKKPHAARRAA